MSIAALLQAAEFLERRDRVSFITEAEHGYASTLPFIDEDRVGGRRNKARKSQGSRTTHNELEKNRRAHLRSCLEKLKDMVPLGPESSRHTTLGLLTKAKRFIKSLEEREKRHWGHKEQLAREQRYLRRRLGRLLGRRRAPSESSGGSLSSPTACSGSGSCSISCSTTCSTFPEAEACCSSASSSSGVSTGVDRSPASVSESDEVDVIGYTSNQSDTDERCSLRSGDSGLPTARRTRSRRA